MPSPPFDLTPEIVAGCQRIERLLGRYEGLHAPRPAPQLRRKQRMRTVHDSLAIEGNTLSLEQVGTILEGKCAIGTPNEILEVRNTNAAYDQLNHFEPYSMRAFKKAHSIMMDGLVDSAGCFRNRSVGIADAEGNVNHVAPPASNVHGLIKDLFAFGQRKKPHLSPLIRAAIVHYEIEFIHPFEDGNGRLGRLWHTLILTRYHPAFEFVTMESIIRDRQVDYYRSLATSDNAGKSTPFVEFAITVTESGLLNMIDHLATKPVTVKSRLEVAVSIFQGRDFTRKDYLRQFPGLSTSTASRDLKRGLQSGVFRKTGDRALTRYQVAND